MKRNRLSLRTIYLCLLLLLGGRVLAQGNLQFNQVLNFDLSGNSTSTGDVVYQTLNFTVPPGKVLKAESASCRLVYSGIESSIIGVNNTNKALVTIDNAPLAISAGPPGSGLAPIIGQTMVPLWLPEGAHTFVLRGYVSNAHLAFAKVSAIEFNVVP